MRASRKRPFPGALSDSSFEDSDDTRSPSSPSCSEPEPSMVITVRVARCKMPYRWREPIPPFESVLSQSKALITTQDSRRDSNILSLAMLRRCMSSDQIEEESWLSSSLIDLILSHYARKYTDVHFMPIEFAAFRLRTMQASDMKQATDILGQQIDYENPRPVIFVANIANMHWNLLRVQHWPVKELQLFEPMGKPSSRHGVSLRYIPKDIIHWLDTCWPLDPGGTWLDRSSSAITRQHQVTGFDCGVACLLYAEKCGQGMMKEDIEESTAQQDFTEFRQHLQVRVNELDEAESELLGSPPPSRPESPAAVTSPIVGMSTRNTRRK